MAEADMDLSAVEWGQLPAEFIQELHRQAETCLTGTIALAADQDQRAVTLCGVFGAGGVALLAAAATLLTGTPPRSSLIHAGLIGAVGFLFSSLLCAFAAHPSDFFVGGYEPKKLAMGPKELSWMVGYAITDLQKRIDHNRKVLVRCARLTQAGMACAALALITSVTVFLTSGS